MHKVTVREIERQKREGEVRKGGDKGSHLEEAGSVLLYEQTGVRLVSAVRHVHVELISLPE